MGVTESGINAEVIINHIDAAIAARMITTIAETDPQLEERVREISESLCETLAEHDRQTIVLNIVEKWGDVIPIRRKHKGLYLKDFEDVYYSEEAIKANARIAQEEEVLPTQTIFVPLHITKKMRDDEEGLGHLDNAKKGDIIPVAYPLCTTRHYVDTITDSKGNRIWGNPIKEFGNHVWAFDSHTAWGIAVTIMHGGKGDGSEGIVRAFTHDSSLGRPLYINGIGDFHREGQAFLSLKFRQVYGRLLYEF